MTRPSNEPCRSTVAMHQPIGSPCPACGHVDLVHPGTPNPSIDACLLCRLEIVLSALPVPPPIAPEASP